MLELAATLFIIFYILPTVGALILSIITALIGD